MITLKTIDAHVSGQSLRLVVDGFPSPRGTTMIEKRASVERHADHLRRIVMLEPRGHRDLCGAVLTEPVLSGSHAGLLFMRSGGYPTTSVEGVVAVTAIALDRHLLMPGRDGGTVVFDTPAGTIRARLIASRGGGRTVHVQNVPSFVLTAGVPIPNLTGAGPRQVLADVAFSGAFYAIVDSESAGLAIDAVHLSELRRLGRQIARKIAESIRIEHPLDAALNEIGGTIFTGPPSDERADLRSATVSADGEVDRSSGGAGMCAVMAVLSAMGLLPDTQSLTVESFIGARLSGRVIGRTAVAEHEAVTCEVEATAWITGEHMFFADDDDPLRDGFLA